MILLILLFFSLTAFVGGGFLVWGYVQYTKPGPTIAETTVVIAQGAGIKAIANTLSAAGVIDDPLIFRLGVRLSRVD